MKKLTYLPPANEVCEGYVFTRVCHSVHGGGGSAWQGGVHGGGERVWQGGMHGGGGMHGRGSMRGRYYEIRSMSGQYASYWNAFLFKRLISRVICDFFLGGGLW